MNQNPRIELIGAAVADQSRSRMLCEMMSGRAFTNKELASAAQITPQTASVHLRHMQSSGLITAIKSGGCVYYKIADETVVELLERMACLTPTDHLNRHATHGDDIRAARTCYNHIAGRLGVAIYERLIDVEAIESIGGTAQVTDQGASFLFQLGMQIETGLRGKLCLDWTERKHHLSGPLAIQFLDHFLKAGWIAQTKATRAIKVTQEGQRVFETHFQISALDTGAHPDAKNKRVSHTI